MRSGCSVSPARQAQGDLTHFTEWRRGSGRAFHAGAALSSRSGACLGVCWACGALRRGGSGSGAGRACARAKRGRSSSRPRLGSRPRTDSGSSFSTQHTSEDGAPDPRHRGLPRLLGLGLHLQQRGRRELAPRQQRCCSAPCTAINQLLIFFSQLLLGSDHAGCSCRGPARSPRGGNGWRAGHRHQARGRADQPDQRHLDACAAARRGCHANMPRIHLLQPLSPTGRADGAG